METNYEIAVQSAEYQSEYSDSKFWTKVKGLAKKAGSEVVYQALLLYYVLKSPDVPIEQKLVIIGAIGYLICPVDLIPDFIPVAGYADDAAALTAAIKMVHDSITPEIEEQARSKANSLFNL